MTTGERMRLQRKAEGLSAEDVAAQLGVSAATIYRYENGDIEKVPGNLLEPLAKALHCTPAYLMGWEYTQKNNDAISGIAMRMMEDEEFLAAAQNLYSLPPDKFLAAKAVIDALTQQLINQI